MPEPTSISELLQSLIGHKNWSQKIKQHQVFLKWSELVGKDISQRAKPIFIRGSVLWVAVSDSVWMQQLHLQKNVILDKLSQRFPGVNFTDIRFQVDSSLMSESEAALTRR